MNEIVITSPDEAHLRTEIEGKKDPESLRIKRFLAMPDLARKEGSPIRELAERIVNLPDFKNFDVVNVPEIVPVKESFDLFNFPPDHPARSRSDTYYLTDDRILRTHTTIMWYYYLLREDIKKKIAAGEDIGVLSYGKVYRKDEIDRKHMNVFHQMDGLYLCPKEKKVIGMEDLQKVLLGIAKAIYGENIKYRFNPDTFPYTNPSVEMEVDLDGPDISKFEEDLRNIEDPRFANHVSHEANRENWVEVLGAGVVMPGVLDNLGVDSKVWNGWAFGFGLERLAILSVKLPDIRLLWSEDPRVTQQLKLGNVFKEVSKYPPITRDISFVVNSDFAPNNYFDLIRDVGGDIVEEVSLLDKYENAEKFGPNKISYTYRIVYRSNERTLTMGEIEPLQNKIIEETKKQFGAEIR